jgi:hypothetical protein
MSRNEMLFSFFTKSKHDTKISTQQLYIMYTILHKNNPTLTFSQFYLYTFLFFKFFKKLNKTYLFLGYVFFFKTNQVKLLFNTYSLANATSVSNATTINKPTYIFSSFWRKFRKLKRPVTDLHYSDYFTTSYKNKLAKYSTAGFLILLDAFYILKSKPGTFSKNLVQVNKPLLVTPKYSSSSINKYLSLDSIQNFEFQFLRKNKVYNKGRYSRCRQNYRTGVYMCMYLSVVSIFGLYY